MDRSFLSRSVWAFPITLGISVLASAQEPLSSIPAARFEAEAARALSTSAEDLHTSRIEGPVRLDALGLDLFVVGARDGRGAKATVAISPEGRVVDLAHMRNLDRAFAQRIHGRIEPVLRQRLSAAPPGERHLVAVWVEAPDVQDLRLARTEQVEDLRSAGALTVDLAAELASEHALDIASVIGERTRATAARLEAAGYSVQGAAEDAPIVFIEADATEIRVLQGETDVRSIGFAGERYAARLSTARAEIRANTVNTMVGGATGAGVRVAIVEDGQPCSNNPHVITAERRMPSASTDTHTTMVAACVRSTHNTHRGVATGAILLAANGATMTPGSTGQSGYQGSVDTISWAVQRGAPILNLSYGAATPGATLTSFDKYLDYVVRNQARTITIAAGNSGSFAGDPGAGFNAIAVGNFNDGGTDAWNNQLAPESMDATSSWRNPTTGVETPQIAAPGSMTMSTCSPGFWSPTPVANDNGTSFAAPLVAGTAALMIERQPSLAWWPEAVRAILMAGAWHNIEGSPVLSSRDGAGGLDSLAAYRCASRGPGWGYKTGTLTPGSFDANGVFDAHGYHLQAGAQVRVCLSWNSQVNASYTGDGLNADLDLWILGPTGSLVAWSVSSIQPFEIVRFTAPSTGTYRIKILRDMFLGSSEYYGLAVSLSTDA